jgi:hypothetical protein
MVSSTSLIFPSRFSVVARLTSKFTSLEEPADDSDIAIVADFLADGSDFVGSERQIKPMDPTQKFKLPIARSTS